MKNQHVRRSRQPRQANRGKLPTSLAWHRNAYNFFIYWQGRVLSSIRICRNTENASIIWQRRHFTYKKIVCSREHRISKVQTPKTLNCSTNKVQEKFKVIGFWNKRSNIKGGQAMCHDSNDAELGLTLSVQVSCLRQSQTVTCLASVLTKCQAYFSISRTLEISLSTEKAVNIILFVRYG